MKIHAASRLLVTADGEWFEALPDKMKEQYVKEHPESKYAKGWKRTDKPKGNIHKAPVEPVKHPRLAPGQKPIHPGTGKNPKAQKDIERLPPHAKAFVQKGGTKAGSKQRKHVARSVKKNSGKIAKSVMKDNKSLLKAVTLLPKFLQDRSSKSELKQIGKLGFTVLASVGFATALGVTGPVGFLAFMAVKHLAVPALGNVIKSALSRPKQGFGTDGPVKHKSSQAWAASGNHGSSAYGYWSDPNTWVSETEEEWEANFDERGPKIPTKEHDSRASLSMTFADRITASQQVHVHAPVYASSQEQTMQSIIDALSDFAENGFIPDDAWDASVIELANKEGSSDEQSDRPQTKSGEGE